MYRPALLMLLLACSEYDLQGKPDDPDEGDETDEETEPTEEPGDPDLTVAPSAIELGARCGVAPEEHTLSLENRGESTLVITDLSISGDGWTLGAFSVPLSIPPRGKELISVSGTVGSAVLVVRSNDPDSPVVEVPLSASADAPPTVTIATPLDGAVLPGATVTRFEAQVADDVTASEVMELTWSSDVDGGLSVASALPSGQVAYAWDGGARTAGSHTVTLSVTDSCGQTTTDSVSVCQDQGYSADSLDLSTWHFEGSARYDTASGWVELTSASNDQSGTAFQTAGVVSADNVLIEFSFYVSGGSGADGISVTALDTTRMTGFVGSAGGGIGYLGLPGWSIEVDTWHNGEYNDPTANDHLSLIFDGYPYTIAAWAELPEMEDGAWHLMSVSVVAPRVTVSVDGITYIDQDVSGNFSFPAYVGFTAATGGATNYHLIDALEVTRYVCDG